MLLLAILTATDATAVDKFYRQAETRQVGTDVNVTEPSSYSCTVSIHPIIVPPDHTNPIVHIRFL